MDGLNFLQQIMNLNSLKEFTLWNEIRSDKAIIVVMYDVIKPDVKWITSKFESIVRLKSITADTQPLSENRNNSSSDIASTTGEVPTTSQRLNDSNAVALPATDKSVDITSDTVPATLRVDIKQITVYDLHSEIKHLVKNTSLYSKPLLVIDYTPSELGMFYISNLCTDAVNILYLAERKSVVIDLITRADIVIYTDLPSFNADMKKYGYSLTEFPHNLLLIKEKSNYNLFYVLQK